MNDKIRVAHFVGCMNLGGAETFIMNIYRQIDREKVQFDFVCSKKEEAFYDAEIKQLGGRIFYIDEPKKVGLLKSFKQIKNILKKEKFDVVHSHIALYSGIVLIAAKKSNIKIRIAHSHSAIINNSKGLRKIYENIMRMLIEKYVTVKLSCGKLAGEYLYGSLKDVIILNNCIDLEKYNNINNDIILKLKQDLKISENEVVIGHVGRFNEVKNHKFILEIAKNLKNKNMDFKILLVGIGELKNEIEKEIINNNLQNNVITLGARKDIPEIMNVFDVFILPSLFEGFPIVMIEAQAAGIPCVISNTISKEVELGFDLVKFVSLENANDWADKTIEVKSLKFGNKVNEMKLLGYDVSYNIKKIYDVYKMI